MNPFCVNSAKTFIGKHVNLHLNDETVRVNVFLEEIKDKKFLKFRANGKSECVRLDDVSYAVVIPQFCRVVPLNKKK